jgi:hypothetical protein
VEKLGIKKWDTHWGTAIGKPIGRNTVGEEPWGKLHVGHNIVDKRSGKIYMEEYTGKKNLKENWEERIWDHTLWDIKGKLLEKSIFVNT